MDKVKLHSTRARKRKLRIRAKISGTALRPRLSVFRTPRHISVQAIDDQEGRTLAAASTHEKDLRAQNAGAYPGNVVSAALVGKTIAERLLKLGVEKAVYDRGGNAYHGRVKALAASAREAGLHF